MKTFRCSQCDKTVFFANVRCENCGSSLGFIPEERVMAAFVSTEERVWQRVGPGEQAFRPCHNYVVENVCNWMIPADCNEEFCPSCRLTEIIPAFNKPESRLLWYKLELAKRRLVYSLQGLRLPIASRIDDPEHGLAFRFLEDTSPTQRVLTGHANGIITLNVAEADDARREQIRNTLREPYRTLLGHFRHEVGHYYWEVLIRGTPRLEEFRQLFGDEQEDYSAALQRYYDHGPSADWEKSYISAYATMHPWEDWAESWAHYLHMTDALHTAEHWGFSLRPAKVEHAPIECVDIRQRAEDFDTLLFDQWLPLTRFLNSLNRSLGQSDAYPFTISRPAVEKLRFVDRVIRERRESEVADVALEAKV